MKAACSEALRVAGVFAIMYFALLAPSGPATAQLLQQGAKLVGSGAVGNGQQGRAVALSADGTTAAIGGPANNGGTGGVWIFTRPGNTWTQQGIALTATGAGTANQGSAVALSADGNTLLVGGSYYNSGEGAA